MACLFLKQKTLKLRQLHYVSEVFQNIFPLDNMKKTGLRGYVYDFCVDYDAISVVGIL